MGAGRQRLEALQRELASTAQRARTAAGKASGLAKAAGKLSADASGWASNLSGLPKGTLDAATVSRLNNQVAAIGRSAEMTAAYAAAAAKQAKWAEALAARASQKQDSAQGEQGKTSTSSPVVPGAGKPRDSQIAATDILLPRMRVRSCR